MSDLPNKADFIADERPGEYEATFSVRGTIRVTIKAREAWRRPEQRPTR